MSFIYNYLYGKATVTTETTTHSPQYTVISDSTFYNQCSGLKSEVDLIAIYTDESNAFATYIASIILYLKDNLKWTNTLRNGISECLDDEEKYQYLSNYLSKKRGYSVSRTLFTYDSPLSLLTGESRNYTLRIISKQISTSVSV